MKRSIKGWIRTLVIVVAVSAVAVGGYLRFREQPVAAATTASTATVERGSLSATVNAAGNIQSHQTADLSFGQSGTVQKIDVKVGDRVKAGDVLGELDTADLQLQVRSAEVALKNAQDTLAQTQNPNSEQDIASARSKVESAQAAYDKLAAGPSQSDLASAQAQLASAQAAYSAAVKSAGTAGNTLAADAAAVEKAQATLEQAQAAYDKVKSNPNIGMMSQSLTLQEATIDYNSAKAAYEAAAATSDSDAKSKVATAAATLQAAQANLASVKNQVSAADLAAAKATLTQAQNDLDSLLAGSDANVLDIAQNNVEAAQIALDQAKLKQAQAQVVAPFDGTVTAISAEVGQAASGTAFTMADLDHLEIVVNMAEVDVNKVKVGQPAEITLDAVSDLSLQGTVAQIAPAGTQSSGVVNYPVTVSLTKTVESVKTGMTANLDIVVTQRDGVLTVPNRAIKTVNKQKVVTVLFEGQQIQTPVQTGLNNDSVTEITGGLQEGDVVLVSGTTSAMNNSGRAGVGGLGLPGAGGPPAN